MGIFIIILVFIFELSFIVYCIKTKDNQNKLKSWVRIATFITFMGFSLTHIISWGFQWYLLGTFLLIFAIISGTKLFANNSGEKS